MYYFTEVTIMHISGTQLNDIRNKADALRQEISVISCLA